MTERELIDALALEVALVASCLAEVKRGMQEDVTANLLALRADAIRARHARPVEAPVSAKRWWVVDREGVVATAYDEQDASARVALWDEGLPSLSPHRAIFATDADDARAQYAAMEAGDSRSAGQEPHLTPVAGHDPANPTPPADDADAGARLVRMLEENRLASWADLAREVIRQRDEARREAAHYTDMAMQADVSCQREKARADAAEARERELRALCDQLRGGVND